MSATDSDIGDNAKLQYSFATDNEHFEINGSSGKNHISELAIDVFNNNYVTYAQTQDF